jgi:hypothetical protein
MPFTQRTHQALLNALFSKTSNFGDLDTPPTIYVGLSTSTPTVSGGNVTEPSGVTVSDYARVATAAADWGTATNADPSVIQNAEIVEFPELETAAEAWGTITHFVLFDAATSGNVIGWGALSTSRSPVLGDTPRFGVGALQCRLGAAA